MDKMLFILAVGYGIGFGGHLIGTGGVMIMKDMSKKLLGSVMGFTAGLIIAFVCFALLPEAFAQDGVVLGILGLLIGVFAVLIIEERVRAFSIKLKSRNVKYINTGVIVALAIALHNLPEGMAVGALLNTDVLAGLELGLLVALHCIPEAIAFSVLLKQGGLTNLKLLLVTLLLALPMAVGSLLGALLSSISPFFVSLCLSFSGGVMMYVACGEILPESKELWNGRMSTLGALLGFIIGVYMTAR